MAWLADYGLWLFVGLLGLAAFGVWCFQAGVKATIEDYERRLAVARRMKFQHSDQNQEEVWQ
jgi:hypothetical protein